MTTTADETSRKLTFTISSRLHRKVKAIAAIQEVTVADILRDALEDYVKEATEQDDEVRSILQIEKAVRNGQEPTFTWNEVKQERAKREGTRKKAASDR